MDILLVEKDALTRDHVKVGLQQFPDFTVTMGLGYRGVNELRGQHFDCVFLGVDARDPESVGLLQHLRTFNQTVELFVMTSSRHAKDLSSQKAKYDIHSFLTTPIDPKEFFDFIGRFRERHSASVQGNSRSLPRGKQSQREPGGMPQF